MASSTNYYRVGVILSNCNFALDDYSLSVGSQEWKVCFYNNANDPHKFCDLIITNKEPNYLQGIPLQQKNCHGTILVVNEFSKPFLEQPYKSFFEKADFIKHKTCELTEESLKEMVSVELVKREARKGKIDTISLIFRKHTRREVWGRLGKLSWLLIPFIFIVIYFFARAISIKLGHPIYFLCWFVEYEPDCRENVFRELTLLALIYSICNLKVYYDYILSVFDNINNDVFQFNVLSKYIHKGLLFFSPLIFLASALIIFKALFVFKFGFRIAYENGFIDIGSILNRHLHFLENSYLIWYFLSLDVALWLVTKNFFRTASDISRPLSSMHQNDFIREAQKSFGLSAMWDVIILIVTTFFISYLIPDPQSKLAVQLILLQAVYLWLNISTIVSDIKYR